MNQNVQPSRILDTGIAGIVSAAAAINPKLGVILSMAAAYFGPALERRHERAADLIEFVNQHISEFSETTLGDEVFQDGFVYLIEQYTRERNADKRIILQQILLGYARASGLLDFPLEEMTELVRRIRMSDVSVLREALQEEVQQDSSDGSFMLRQDPNAVSRLIYFGLLHEDRTKNGPAIREQSDKNFLYVWVSPVGRQFADYLSNT